MKRFLLILIFTFTAVSLNAQSKNGIAVSTPFQEKNVTISPNPALADIQISVEGKQFDVKSISIYSIIGTEVYKQAFSTAPSKTIDINVRSLKKGKYMVRVTFEDGSSEVATLVKQ